jgi:hypothetical protein
MFDRNACAVALDHVATALDGAESGATGEVGAPYCMSFDVSAITLRRDSGGRIYAHATGRFSVRATGMTREQLRLEAIAGNGR